MTTNASTAPGQVDIVDYYDGRYLSIFVDGVLMDEVYKSSPMPALMSRKNRKRYCEQAGVAGEDDLRFTYYSIVDALEAAGVDANDVYQDHAKCMSFGAAPHPEINGINLDALEDVAQNWS